MREITPTQKPVPSNEIKDLLFNSGLLDKWATSLEHEYIDRFGNGHITSTGMEWIFTTLVDKFKLDADSAMRAAGYVLLDSFQQGVKLSNNEITLRNQALRDERTGEYYRWDGELPKRVLPGSTPQSTGGPVSPERPTGLWTSVGDAALRTSLGAINKKFIGTEFMIADTTLVAGDVVETSSFKFTAGEMPFGGAKYRIGASGAADGMSVFRLENGLFAAAMFEGGKGDITQFGAKPWVDIDNSVIINSALRKLSETTIPIGQFYITKTIYVPRYKKLTFAGGYGNGNTPPESSLVKSADFVGNGIEMAASTIVSGGGIQGRPGNQGDGLHMNGNLARLENFEARWTGGDGVRLGSRAGAYTNCNSCVIDRVYAWQCGGDGIKLHDEGSAPGVSDSNLALVSHCHASWNAGCSINVRKAYWTTVQNCSGHGNGEWGLNISGLPDGTYPEARYTQVIGGDFNEGNALGSMKDEGYFTNIVCGDRHMTPADTRTSLQGSGVRNVISPGVNQVAGMRVKTYTGAYPFIVDGGTSARLEYSDLSQKKILRVLGAGSGRATQFSIVPDHFTPAIPELANFNAFTEDVTLEAGDTGNSPTSKGIYKITYSVRVREDLLPLLLLSGLNKSVSPGSDALFSSGEPLRRWGNIYAANSTISTSDETIKTRARVDTPSELAAFYEIGSLPAIWEWVRKALDEQNDHREHSGPTVQAAIRVMEKHGLDWRKYAAFCYDEWPDADEVVETWEDEYKEIPAVKALLNEDGAVITPAKPAVQVLVKEAGSRVVSERQYAGSRYGFRKEELLFWITRATIAQQKSLDERLSAIERSIGVIQ